jgi:flavin reductase (DIM6/NTAB) family NADH-FMN oxidoreductase RutF
MVAFVVPAVGVHMSAVLDVNPVEDPLMPLHIRDNFYQSTAFFPMPFALITTKNEQGITSIGPYSLLFPLDICEEYSMMLVSRSSSNTATNLRRGSKCALNYIEFDKELLKTVVELGYPGVSAEEKMRDIPFELMESPTPAFRDDPEAPLLVKGAFQVFECEVGGTFDYNPSRQMADSLVEDYFALRVKNVLMRQSFKTKLEEREEFPDMPISYGFRGGSEFWFARHGKPFHIPMPENRGMDQQGIYRMANRLDPDIQFTEEACKLLEGIPAPFAEAALGTFIEKAKKDNVGEVDAAFVHSVNNRWSDTAD